MIAWHQSDGEPVPVVFDTLTTNISCYPKVSSKVWTEENSKKDLFRLSARDKLSLKRKRKFAWERLCCQLLAVPRQHHFSEAIDKLSISTWRCKLELDNQWAPPTHLNGQPPPGNPHKETCSDSLEICFSHTRHLASSSSNSSTSENGCRGFAAVGHFYDHSYT